MTRRSLRVAPFVFLGILSLYAVFRGPSSLSLGDEIREPSSGLPASARNVVVLVDAGNQDLVEQQPQMRYKMARIIVAELESKHAAKALVSPREVVTATQADPDFSNRSTVEIGKRFKADTVLHLVVRTYAIRPTTGTDTFSGRIDIGLRVIDVTEARQVFPGLERFHFVDVRSPTGISADSASRAEDKLLEGLALKVGQVFVEYEVDSLPRTNEVK